MSLLVNLALTFDKGWSSWKAHVSALPVIITSGGGVYYVLYVQMRGQCPPVRGALQTLG
jgi:hypothetical protein